MKISLLKDFKIFDAGSISAIEKILGKININSGEITLDLSRCIIDYPATSLLLDKFLADISKCSDSRLFIIQTHLDILELLLLHWLFIGSKFFKIDSSQRKSQLEDFKQIISEILKSKAIIMKIEVLDKDENVLKFYEYGK